MQWTRRATAIIAINGQRQDCLGIGSVEITVQGQKTCVEVLVVPFKPLNYALILGMNAIVQLGGVQILPNLCVKFGALSCDVANGESRVAVCYRRETRADSLCGAAREEPKVDPGKDLVIVRPDYTARFNEEFRRWYVKWNWATAIEPRIRNTVAQYNIPAHARDAFETEVEEWITKGYLIPYDENELGPPKALLPLMAAIQVNKDRVRPVLDYREINSFISAFSAKADVCAEKIRTWRKMGVNAIIMDLRNAYFQLFVDKSLLPYQTVQFKGRRFALTRVGFGINVAPLVMTEILACVLQQDPQLAKATSCFVDDIYLNEDMAPARTLVEHLEKFGLRVKPPEKVADGARVLGLHVWGETGTLRWKRDNALPKFPERLTRREIFSICGQLIGHLPVCGQLRVMASYLKRLANGETEKWDDVIDNPDILAMTRDMLDTAKKNDPARGRWDVSGRNGTVWVDSSSLAMGVVLEIEGNVVEDGSWLRPQNDSGHINMAELDALIKGLNLAISWNLQQIKVFTDSQTVYHWVSETLSGRTKIKSSSASEMLIHRRLGIVEKLVEEFQLSVTVSYVRSESNKADVLTRVPSKWLKPRPEHIAGAAYEQTADIKVAVKNIHESFGHPGIKRTQYFAAKNVPHLSKKVTREVVSDCQVCKSIDPAPAKWIPGTLSVAENWKRVSIDVTHFRNREYLSLIDCGPSRYTIWKRLNQANTVTVLGILNEIFFERSPPNEILLDNSSVFRSESFRKGLTAWGVALRFRAAHWRLLRNWSTPW